MDCSTPGFPVLHYLSPRVCSSWCPLHVYTTFIQFTDGHLGCFHFLAITNSAATAVWTWVWMYLFKILLSILSETYPKVGLLDHMVIQKHSKTLRSLPPLSHVLCLPFVCGKLQLKNKLNQRNEKCWNKGKQSKEKNNNNGVIKHSQGLFVPSQGL